MVHAQVQDLALAGRKALDALPQLLNELLARQRGSDILRAVRGSLDFVPGLQAYLPAPMMLADQVEPDRKEPGAKPVGLAEYGEPLERAQPSLLKHLAGILVVAEQAAQGSENRFGMPSDKVMKTLSIPRQDPSDDVAIAGFQGR